MKFDNVIMNPPYDGNLHLNIINNILNFLSPNGKITNLSPIRWLQDPLAEYKNGSDWIKFENVRNHIESISNTIDKKDFSNYFIGGDSPIDIGIYVITNNLYRYCETFKNNIIDKILSLSKDRISNVVSSLYDTSKNFVVINRICGRFGYQKNCLISDCHKKMYIDFSKYQSGASQSSTNDSRYIISFKDSLSANNFINSITTTFFRYFMFCIKNDVNVYFKYIPYMGNSINSRTGLKGYESEWTDNDFYQFFNITKDEQKVIEETMKPYIEIEQDKC